MSSRKRATHSGGISASKLRLAAIGKAITGVTAAISPGSV
jgi:hypothetical protein